MISSYDWEIPGLCNGCPRSGDCMPAGTAAALERCETARRVHADALGGDA